MTEEERRRRLIAMGLDPTQYRYVTNEEEVYEDTTGGGAFLTGVGQSVGGGIGGLGGAAIGASYGSALGPLGTLVGGIGGGIVGGIAGGFGQAAAEDAFLDDTEEQALALKRQVALEKHPYLTLSGQFLPSLAAARPSLTTIRNIPGALANAPTRSQTAIQRYALASSGFGGGLEAGIEAGSQALRGGGMDWGRVGVAGTLGSLFTEPTRAFGKIGATVARKGETSKQFLERTGMLRPLTEVEAIARNVEIAAKHQKSLKEATEKADRDLDAAEAVKATEDEVKVEAEEARRTEPTKAEEGDAEKHVNRDIDAADTARMNAHGAWKKAENELNNLPPDLNETPLVARQRRLVAEKKAASDEANDIYVKAKEDRVRMRKERAAKELEANDLWERHSRRKSTVDGTEPSPLPDNLLDIAQGLAAKLGITWHEAVPKLHAMDKAGKRIDLRGKYNVREHSVTLDKLEAQADTPFHEYLHGLWQVLKRSADRKHSGLVELFENDLFKDSPRWQELASSGERKVWSEERIVESTGKALSERMDNPPKGWLDKFNRWLDDWRLERDARKGFPVKEGELSDKHFQRIVDWMAMRGERQPALQPKQLELMLGDLTVRSSLDDFGPLSGGKRYADDLLTEEAVAAEEAAPVKKGERTPVKKAPTDPIDRLKAKVADGKKITVSHVGAEDLSGTSQDALRNSHVRMDLERRMGTRADINSLDEKPINLTKGQNFLEGAGHGADIVVLHRIPNERTAQAGEQYTGPVAKDHTLNNWQKAISNSNAELVYITWHGDDLLGSAGDFTGLDFSQTPGYKVLGDLVQEPQKKLFLTVLKKEKAVPEVRAQPVKPEEFVAAVDVMAKHDPTLLKKYSKRVRGKMMDRIKKGTFSVAQGQQILARFAGRPFPSDMSGEEMAQVINGLEMYHGSPDADAIKREGFKGEKLSPSGIIGGGIYMTPKLQRAEFYGEPISIRTNFKKLLDLNQNDNYAIYQDAVSQAADDKARNALLLEKGYDGLTFVLDQLPPLLKAGGGYREVVAFREPFQRATDQLHEYYGGERLQDVDTFLEDMNEYQLNTNTDHFASNPAAKQPWLLDSIVEKIRKTGHKGSEQERKTASIVANAADATARDAQRLEGEFLEAFEFIEQRKVSLSQEDGQHAAIYMAHMRRGMPEGIPAATRARYNAPDSPVKHYVDFFYRNYTEVRRRQIEAKMKIWHPKSGELLEAGTDPSYAPEMMNQDMWRILNGKEGAKARTDAKKELVDWWEANLDEPGSITREELTQAADDYIAKLSGGSAHLGSTKFGALRKAESIGLPLRLKEDGNFVWIENHAGRAYQRYMRRFARDFSFYKNMESNDFVRQALGLMKQDKTYDAALPEGDNPFHVRTGKTTEGIIMNKAMTTDKNLNDFIKAYLGYYEGDELFGRTANRIVVSHWLGVMSGVRDLFSSYVFALPHLRGVDMPLMLTSIKDFKRNWHQSHLLGVNKSHYNRLEFATETHNKLADTVNRWSDIVSKYSGRTPLERLTRAAQFGIGRAAVLQHMGLAEGASITADRNLRRLGQMSGVDVKALRNHANKDLADFKIPDEQLDDMLDRMAASWVDANQGTYDVRGVPMFTMHGPMANFTSLARWNIEKLNMTRKELVNPIVDEGDWRPFIKATLGAAFTGTLLLELSEFINNKFRANPTLAEAVREGDKEEMTYAVADALNYAGYFGLASALFNDIPLSLMRGARPGTGGVVFPAFDFVGGALMEPLFDATTAISEGAEPLPTVFNAFNDVIKGTMQTYRILHNHTLGSKDVEKQNIRRDLRIFRRFEGVRGTPPSSDVGNRYLRPGTREFKEAETLQESVDLLPAAFEEQRERAKGRGDKLKSSVSGLYTIPDKTLPAISTPEGVEEFMRYKDYVMRQRGGGTWRRIFNEWVANKNMTATKKVLVKSYVQHLIERGE